ncbi:hypothetical protein BJY52DRAFT_1191408 [Lactarius psammicola]|nr:hypothetical protein BJY52DRAFT_1191408 [Lactarius psammicola]
MTGALYEVSSSSYSKYGAYLSKQQVAESFQQARACLGVTQVAPHPDTLKLVKSWLGHHQRAPSTISTIRGCHWLTRIGVPVSHVRDLLSASSQIYRHADTNDTILRTVGYAPSVALHAHAQTDVPTTYSGSPHTSLQTLRVRRSGIDEDGI